MTLFNKYIIDLPQVIKKLKGINISIFTDNLIVYIKTKNILNQQKILEDKMNLVLQILHNLTMINHMGINTTKTLENNIQPLIQ